MYFPYETQVNRQDFLPDTAQTPLIDIKGSTEILLNCMVKFSRFFSIFLNEIFSYLLISLIRLEVKYQR